MRKSLNNNPLIAIGAVAVLGLGVALLLLSSLSSSGSSSEATSSTTGATATTPAATGTTPTDPAAPAATTPAATPTDPAAAAAVDPATGLPAAPAAPVAAAAPPPVGSFVAGPGLPSAVVTAYKRDDAVALLIVKRNGIDDRAVRVGYKRAAELPRVTAFQTLAEDVAKYARITEGVDLDRVPALVMIRPRSVTGSGPPQATVTYGFNSPAQFVQAVKDAQYKGPEDLPYHPR
jgi:hypothetical protein